MIGEIVSKYESGNRGYDAIGKIPGDVGGASYGKYQLASGVGTLQKFLKASKYYLKFAGMKPGSPEFDALWIEMSQYDAFRNAQHSFIKMTHYDPVLNYWLSLELARDRAIDEMLWSMGVQHSFAGCKKIIDDAEDNIPAEYTTADAIRAVYAARVKYVNGINITDKIRAALIKRYKLEIIDVLNIKE